MKNIWKLLLVSSLLAGCSMYSVDESADSNEEETTQEEEESQDVSFVLQESNRIAQVSPLNDDALRVLSDHVNGAAEGEYEVGTAGELTLDYSGVYLTGEDAVFAVYLLTNRTNVDMFNLQFEVTQETSGNDTVLEAYPLYLGKEIFGVLEQNTAMPVYIEMEPETAEDLDGLQFGDGEITLHHLNFDTEENPIGEDTNEDEFVEEFPETEGSEETEEDSIPEGYNFGYHPAYMIGVRQEEELMEDIQAGNVPDLTVQIPPIIANDIQGGEIMSMIRSEEIVNPASGFSQDGALSLFWTGISTGQYETTVFLLANRTGKEISDEEITVNFQTSDGDDILDNETLTLSSAEYGTFPTDTLTPIMVDIPAESRENFSRLLDPQEGVAPQYEIVTEE